MNVWEVAWRYKVPVITVDEVPLELSGPRRGYGCDPLKGCVYVDVKELRLADNFRPEAFLHELVHVLVHPPGHDIYRVEETWILLGFERCLARHTLGRDDFRKVVEFQEMTEYESWDPRTQKQVSEYLGDLRRPESHSFWRRMLKRCRKTGILDKKNRPTWRRPNWRRLSETDWEDDIGWP